MADKGDEKMANVHQPYLNLDGRSGKIAVPAGNPSATSSFKTKFRVDSLYFGKTPFDARR